MTPERLEIARRLVACKGWAWLPGMIRVDPRHPGTWQRVISVRTGEIAHVIDAAYVARGIGGAISVPIVGSWVESEGDDTYIPDLNDDITRLGLLAVVRRAWGDNAAFARPVDDDDEAARRLGAVPGWQVFVGNAIAWGRTEEAALLAALEACT